MSSIDPIDIYRNSVSLGRIMYIKLWCKSFQNARPADVQPDMRSPSSNSRVLQNCAFPCIKGLDTRAV